MNLFQHTLIDYNGNDAAYYNKEIQGLIVKDSIPQLPQLTIGDNITAMDSTTYNRACRCFRTS